MKEVTLYVDRLNPTFLKGSKITGSIFVPGLRVVTSEYGFSLLMGS